MADQQRVSAELLAYLRATSLREDDVLRHLREETAALPGGSAMQVMAIREFNERLRDDDRVDISLLPVADGITLVRKRAAQH